MKWVAVREWFRFGFLSRVFLAPTSFFPFDARQRNSVFRSALTARPTYCPGVRQQIEDELVTRKN